MAAGGVGEAMLIGAAVGATAGGAGAAIQGGDPLKGALMGGAMGAVGGGLGGAAGAGTAVAPTSTAASTAAGTTAGTAAGTTAGTAAGTTAGTSAGIGAGTTTGSVFGGASEGIAGATNLGAGISNVGTAGGTGVTSGVGAGSAGNFGPMVSYNTEGLNALAASQGAGTSGAAGAGLEVAPNVIAPTSAGTTGGAGTTAPTTNIFGQTAGTSGYLSNTQLGMIGGTAGLGGLMQAERDQYGQPNVEYSGPLSKLKYDPDKFTASAPTYAPASVYRPTYAAEGGIMRLAQGGMATGPVERMSQNMMGGQGNMFPLSQQEHTNFATPTQMPASAEIIRSDYDTKTNPYSGVMMARGGIARYDGGGLSALAGIPSSGGQTNTVTQTSDQGIAALPGKKRMLTKEQMDAIALQGMSKGAMKDIYGQMAEQGLAAGGHLGGYSDGGRMLKGPGDGMSDNIPATIAGKQPARLADGEFVIPADVVSHLGNGSTDAGAKQLYAMMNRVRKARTGNSKQGKQIKPAKYMAA